ncbi:MAG: DUF1850 domain-containing protein [Armatimonadota bacterium]|nr:DUF1850 domain-containing protein [Armatimonadota bacterium]MDR5696320.1 DUF1850 domain-containing protein [Armatimonadota bacterium]
MRTSLARVLIALCLAPVGCAQRRPLLSVCLSADARFEIRYVHSVEKTPVIEIYRVGPDGAISIEGMRFRSLGWGLPSEGYVYRDGWYVVSDLHRRIGTLHLRVSKIARHELLTGARTFPLYDRVRDGAGVVVAASRTPDCPLRLEAVPASP